MNQENFIGGWYSRGLTRLAGFKGALRAGHGYGIYVTDKRIVGAEQDPKGLLGRLTLGSMLGEKGLGYRPRPGECSVEENIEALKELERIKDVEIRKEDITEIILKPPRLFLSGEFRVKASGKEVSIIGIPKMGFYRLKEVLSKFYPSTLRVG